MRLNSTGRPERIWLEPVPAALALLAAVVLHPAGQGPTVRAFQTPGAESAWAGVYTDSQAQAGERVYAKACAVCHAKDLSGDGFAPPLVNETFVLRWKDEDLASLFIVLKATMPQDAPGSLSDEDNVALIAFLLKKNQFPSGPTVLRPDSDYLKRVTFGKP